MRRAECEGGVSIGVGATALQVAKLKAASGQQRFGDLWLWLQPILLKFEVARGPVGIFWGRFGALCIPNQPQIDPKRPRPDLGQPQSAAT